MPTPEGAITSTETWLTPAQEADIKQAQTEEPLEEYIPEETTEETDATPSDN